MTPQKIRYSLIAGLVSVLMVTLPIAPAFAKNKDKGRGYKSPGAKKMSVRQHNKVVHRKHHSRPPAYKPPKYKHHPPRYKHRPPRYKGRYYRSYDAWKIAAGVTAGIIIGTMLASPPPQSRTVVVKEHTYYVHENVYYEPVMDGGRVVYQVVPPPY